MWRSRSLFLNRLDDKGFCEILLLSFKEITDVSEAEFHSCAEHKPTRMKNRRRAFMQPAS